MINIEIGNKMLNKVTINGLGSILPRRAESNLSKKSDVKFILF